METSTNTNPEDSTIIEKLAHNVELAGRIMEMVRACEDTRQRWTPMWYDLEQKWLGNYYLTYMPVTNTFQFLKTDPGRTKRTLNELRVQVRGVKKTILANPPAWEVTPDDRTQEAKTEANIASYLLDDIYTESGAKQVAADVLWYGMLRSIGWFEAYWDEEKKMPGLRAWDAFDILVSPGATDETDALYMAKQIPKTIRELKDNPHYDTDGFEPISDQKMAANPIKEQLLQVQQSKSNPAFRDFDTVILYEVWIKEVQQDGSRKIRIVSVAADTVLRNELTEMEDFPFVSYKPERKPGALYTTPWMYAIVDSVKAMMRVINQAEDYATKLQAGWILKKKGTKATKIFNMTGAVIEYSGQVPPVVSGVPPMPSSFLELAAFHEKKIQDYGGIHSDSLGRIRASDLSGVAIARVQAADAGNVSDPIDNMEIAFERLAHKLLMIAGENWTTLRQLTYIDDQGKEQEVGVVGDAAADAIKKEAKMVVRDFNKIRVSITPASVLSEVGQRQDARELFEAGVLEGDTGREAVLEAYKWGSVRKVMRRMQEERQPAYDAAVAEAEAENQRMTQGQNVVAQPGQDHRIHMLLHSAFLKAQQVQTDANLRARVVAHMREHEQLAQQEGGLNGQVQTGGQGGGVPQGATGSPQASQALGGQVP